MDAPPRTPYRTPRRPGAGASGAMTPGTPLEQTSATPIVDLSTIERNKENILSLKGGRSASVLAHTFGLSQHARSAELDARRVEWERLLASQDEEEVDDPLDAWYRYMLWVIEVYPAGQSVESGLVTLLERATRHFKDAVHYHQDPRYLKMWVNYAHNVDAPRDIFNFCLANEIGTRLAWLYEELATVYATHGVLHEADGIYRLGIARKASPLERLRRNYARFQKRVIGSETVGHTTGSRTYEDALRESAQLARTQPPAGSGPLRIRSGGPGGLSLLGNKPGSNNGARAPIMEDRDERAGQSRVRDPWIDVGTRGSRKQENALEPGKMAGTRIEINSAMIRRRGGGAPLAVQDVFQDEDEDDAAPQPRPDPHKNTEGDELKRNPFKHWGMGIKLTPSAEDLALPSAKAKDKGKAREKRHRDQKEYRSRSDRERPHSSSSRRRAPEKEKVQYAASMEMLYPGIASRLGDGASHFNRKSHETGERSMDEVSVALHYPSSALSDTLDPWSHLDAVVGKWMPEPAPKVELRGGFLMAVDEEYEMDVDMPIGGMHPSMPERTPLASKRTLAPLKTSLGDRPILGEKVSPPIGQKLPSSKTTLGEKLLGSAQAARHHSAPILGEKALTSKTPTFGERPLSTKKPPLGEKLTSAKTVVNSDDALPIKTPVLEEKTLLSKAPVEKQSRVPSMAQALSNKTPVLGEKILPGKIPGAPPIASHSQPKSVLGEKRAAHTPKANSVVKKPAPAPAGDESTLPTLPSPSSRKPLFAAPLHAASASSLEKPAAQVKRPPSPTVVTKAAMLEVETMFNGDDGESSEDSESDSDSDEDDEDGDDDDGNDDHAGDGEKLAKPIAVPLQAPPSARGTSNLQIYEDETDIFAPPQAAHPTQSGAPQPKLAATAPAGSSELVSGTPMRPPSRALAQRGGTSLVEAEDEDEEEYGAPSSLVPLEEDGEYRAPLSPITEVTEVTRFTMWAPSPAPSRGVPRMSSGPPATPSARLPSNTSGRLAPATPRAPLLPRLEEPESEEAAAVDIPNPCTPDDAEILSFLLARLPVLVESENGFVDLSGDSVGSMFEELSKASKTRGKKSLDATGTISRSAPLNLGGSRFQVTEKLGEGGFASVYLAHDLDGVVQPDLGAAMADLSISDSDNDSDDGTEGMVAIKAETPANRWEFYVLRKVQSRLAAVRAGASVIKARRFVALQDASLLFLDYVPQGTLLRLVNHARDAGVAAQGDGLDELLAMFFTVELLRTVEALHHIGMIHGDVKIDNCLLRVAAPESSIYKPSGADGWDKAGLSLVDFGRSIDTTLYPPAQTFRAGWQPTAQDVPAIRMGRSWKFDVDYMGVAAVAYTMLYGKHLDTVEQDGGRLAPAGSMRRYWNKDIWSDFFALTLNPFDGNACMIPPLSQLTAIRERMEAHLAANGNRMGKNLKGMLKKIMIWSMD